MAIGWGPVILGVTQNDLEKALHSSLDDAKQDGLENAHRATISTSNGVKVDFGALSEPEAKALWSKLEQKVKEQLPVGATITV